MEQQHPHQQTYDLFKCATLHVTSSCMLMLKTFEKVEENGSSNLFSTA